MNSTSNGVLRKIRSRWHVTATTIGLTTLAFAACDDGGRRLSNPRVGSGGASGASATGGSAGGGSATGGSATGGASGASASGGSANGGSASGASATGGSASGGSANGGSASGGSAGGGASGPIGLVPENLDGYWDGGRNVGNCVDVHSYLRFFRDGRVQAILVNNDSCHPQERGTVTAPGTFALSGSTLAMRQDDGTLTTREDVAPAALAGRINLFRGIFVGVDGSDRRLWRYAGVRDSVDSSGNSLYQEVHIELEFSAPLALSGTGTGNMVTRFQVIQRAPARGVAEDVSGTFAAVSCRFGSVEDRQVINLDALPDGDYPDWVKNNVLPHLYGALWLNPLAPGYLSSYGGWIKLDSPPAGL